MLKNFFISTCLIVTIFSCAPKVTKAPDISAPKAPKGYTAYIVRDNINMRREANAQSAKIKKVNNGLEVQVLQNKDGWYKVINPNDQQGWVRSDFVGTKSLSYARLVTDFAETTMTNFKTELFIDEKKPYAVIYMVLPQKYYATKKSAQNYAKNIGLKYQDVVYPGKTEIRIMEQDKKNLFTRLTLKPIGPVGLKAPFLKYGRLFAFERVNGNEISIKILVPAELTENTFLKMSDEISVMYGDNISKIEIYFVEDSSEGIKYYAEDGYIPADKKVCRFYYIEDSNGPDYQANFCNKLGL